jgi:predicted TIM-barrel fold metal-dependent hydrolase
VPSDYESEYTSPERRKTMADSYDLNWLVSVDDHVLEPPHLWQTWVPVKHRELAPRLVQEDDGEFWIYDGKRMPTPGLAAVAGKTREEFSPLPITYDEMRPGCYDAKARVEDMNRAGILASLCFPSVPRFCGQLFTEGSDHELGLACVKGYNDWMIEEWCTAVPGRFIPMIIVPLWDAELAAAEVRRCGAKGARAVAFSENPFNLGLPTIYDRNGYWDPFLAACNETATVVCMHVGSGTIMARRPKDSPQIVGMAWGGAETSGAMIEWLFSPPLQKFADLKVAFSEGGIGWIPYYLERATQSVLKHRAWVNKTSLGMTSGDIAPIEAIPGMPDLYKFDVRQTFRDHIYGCFIDDVHGVRSLQEIGTDNVMIETDYPHSDSSWPNSISRAHEQLAGLPDEQAYKVLRGNAERVYRFEPADPALVGSTSSSAS